MWIVLALLLVSATARGLPPDVIENMRKTNPLVLTQKNLEYVWRLRPGKDHVSPSYVVVDVTPESVTTEMRHVLLNYVETGGGLALTGESVSILLGHPARVQSQTRPRNYEEYEKPATIVRHAIQGVRHPLLTGVEEIEVNREKTRTSHSRGKSILTGDTRYDHRYYHTHYYFEGKLTEGVALFAEKEHLPFPNKPDWAKEERNTPPTDYALYVLTLGSGRIVACADAYKNLPLPTNAAMLRVHDNERFAANLDQWLAGFPVPGAATSSSSDTAGQSPASSTTDVMTLKNGDVLMGRLQGEKITIQASYAKVGLDVEGITRITFEGDGNNMDVVVLTTGDRLSGTIQDKTVKFKMLTGVEIEIDKDKLKEVVLAPRVAHGTDDKKPKPPL